MALTIAFVVENGTSKTDATSYATVIQYKQYWLNKGVSIGDSDVIIQGLLNVAAEYLDMKFKFLGIKSDTDQRREWPRAIDGQLYEDTIDSDEIPQDIIDAACYLAYQHKTGNLWPIDEAVGSRSLGPVSTTYKMYEGFKTFPYVDSILKKYISSSAGLTRVN